MSLILDALARAERDQRRDDGAAPGALIDGGDAAPRASHWPWIAISLALLLCLALLWRWPLAPQVSPQASGDAAVPAVVADGRRADVAPQSGAAAGKTASATATAATPSRSAALSRRRNDTAVAALYDAAAADRAAGRAGDQPPDALSGVSPPQTAGDPAMPGASTTPPAVAVSDAPTDAGVPRVDTVVPETPIDPDQVLRAVRAEASAKGLQPHPVPLLADLSKQFRDSVPTLMYLGHDFRSTGLSSVLVNGETLRVGDRTRNVELREILSDSAVFRFGATDFRLRALNSWVNL